MIPSDNGNHMLDCRIGPVADPHTLERDVLAIPGVVDTGLFLGMADTVLVGDRQSFRLLDERTRYLVTPTGRFIGEATGRQGTGSATARGSAGG